MTAGPQQFSMFSFDATGARPRRRRYPHSPGAKGNLGTSQEAAQNVSHKARRLHALMLAQLRLNPDGLSADELASILQEDRLNIRPRCTELRLLGKIVPSKKRRPNISGANATIWLLAEETPPAAGPSASPQPNEGNLNHATHTAIPA